MIVKYQGQSRRVYFDIFRTLFLAAIIIFITTIVLAPRTGATENDITNESSEQKAPRVSIVFSDDPSERSFRVVFTEPMVAAEAENLSNYFLVDTINTEEGKASLVDFATAVYDAESHSVVITLMEKTQAIRSEQLQWGIRSIHAESGAVNSETLLPSAPLMVPTAPSLLTGKIGSDKASITWSWTASGDPGEYASGISGYSYRLLKDGVESGDGTGVLDKNIQTYTVSNVATGRYTLELWSLDRVGNESERVISEAVMIKDLSGQQDGETPILDGPIEPLESYEYVTKPSISSALNQGSDASRQYELTDESVARVAIADSSSTTTGAPVEQMVTNQAVITPTTDGWSIFGVLWYWWLLLAAFVAGVVFWIQSLRKRKSVSNL